MNRICNCHQPQVRIPMGNDFTVEARTSVYDTEKGMYVPFDISSAEDVAISIVGLYRRIAGGDVKVTPSGVSASFPGTVPVGRYGVEILFRDSEGKGRVFERNLFEVVGSSGDATLESSAEGETGDGHNISVDVRTRTVRIGKSTGVTDYTLLENKPSINGHVLEGDKTADELGFYSKDRINELLASKREVYKLSVEEANALLSESNYPMESMPEILKPLLTKLKEKIWMTLEAPVDVLGISGSGPAFSFTSLDAYCQTVDIKNDDEETKGALFLITGNSPGVDSVEYRLIQVESPQTLFQGTIQKYPTIVDWDINDEKQSGYIANKPETQRLLIKVFESSGRISMYPQDIYEAVHKLKVPIFIGEVQNTTDAGCFSHPVIHSEAHKNSNGTYGIDLIWLSTNQEKIVINELSFINGKSLYYDSLQKTEINPYKLSILPDFIKSGDGTKFLNDKGEYADPVAGVKSSVEALAPYDCSWAWNLYQGDEAPEDKVDELRNAIGNGRTLFKKYTNKDGYDLYLGVTADYRNMDDTSIILYSISRFGISWITIDDSSDDYVYVVSARGFLECQEKLVSGTTIKTVNGQSLLGAGDITLLIPTKVSELANDAGYAKAAVIETFTDASEISVTCESGKIRQGSNIATLTIGCAASDNSTAAEERMIFSTGSSVEGITVTGVSWANGDTPSFKANKVYEISVSYVPMLGRFLATYAEY